MKLDDILYGSGRLFDVAGVYNDMYLRQNVSVPMDIWVSDAMTADMEKLSMDVVAAQKRMEREYGNRH